jgi:hypothetical protein
MKCYEYFDCKFTNCIARFDDRHCWQILRTDCYKDTTKIQAGLKKTFGKYDKKICDTCAYREEIFNTKK